MSQRKHLGAGPKQRIDLKELRRRPKVAEWLSKVSREGTGSEHTQHQYVKELRKFIEWAYGRGIVGMDSEGKEEEVLLSTGDKKLEKNPKKSAAEEIVEQYFEWLEEERKKARSGCVRAYGVLRSFFRSFGIMFIEKTPKVWFDNIQRPPLKEQLHRVWEAASLDEKLMIGLARDLGWRREDIVSLTYGDMKQDYEAGEEYIFVQKTTKKERVVANNFIGKEAAALLREKLEQRKKTEKFTEATPILPGRRTEPIGAEEFSRRIKQAGSKIGIHLTSKLLRKWFRTQATNAGVPRDRVCEMGGWAKPGVGRHYDLPTREELLPQFKAAEPFLMFTKASVISADEVSLEALRRIAKSIMPEDVFARLEIHYKNPQLMIADKIKVTEEEIERWKKRATKSGGLPITNLVSKDELKGFAKVWKALKILAEEP